MKKLSENRLVSLCISAIISLFLRIEISFIVNYTQVIRTQFTLKLVNVMVWLACIVLFCFLQKKMNNSKQNRLIKYFFFALLISITAVFVVLFLLSKIANVPAILQYMQFHFEKQSNLISYAIANTIFLLMLVVFIGVFSSVMKAKVKYIQYISKSVKKMECNGFGSTIEIKNDDELSELGICINNMSKTLYEKQEMEKQEEETKNRIIADISHDLRTPLTSVVGYLNLLKEDGFEHKELCTQYTEVIDRRIVHMTDMINQLFEYTKLIQSDIPLQLRKKDLTTVINYINCEYQYLLKKTDKTWEVHCPNHAIYVNIDEEKITRAIGNLLENARKYSLPSSEISLNVEEKTHSVAIELSNETNLIKKEDLKDIFERFYRIDHSRTENDKNGTGLGLPIVKRIIELHGGDVQVKLSNQMITFTIELPCI